MIIIIIILCFSFYEFWIDEEKPGFIVLFRHGKEYVKERFPRLEELYLDHNKLVEDELFIHLAYLKK